MHVLWLVLCAISTVGNTWYNTIEQSQVSVYVYTLLTVVVWFSPGIEFAKCMPGLNNTTTVIFV